MVALPGGTTASAKLWLLAFPDGVPTSSRIEEPSAVMKALRCSRRTMSIERRLVSRCGRGSHWCGSLALARKAALVGSSGVPQNMARVGPVCGANSGDWRSRLKAPADADSAGMVGLWSEVYVPRDGSSRGADSVFVWELKRNRQAGGWHPPRAQSLSESHPGPGPAAGVPLSLSGA